MAGAQRGIGTTIAQGVTTIGVLTGINSPEKSQDSVETTTLDSADGFKTFIGGMKEGGEVSLKGYFDVSDAGQVLMDTTLNAGTVDSYTITFPSSMGSPTFTFDALVSKFKIGEANLEDAVEFECTLKISGKPTLGTSASTGASAATFVQTDGSTALTAAAMTPTFATGTYYYNFTFTTETAFKPKVTAASHTIKIYVDGVYSETVSSGSAGSSISISAGATKQVDAVVYEAGKTPKTYRFAVARLS
jgi:predicted secreted protein